jgi:hypothetical protein
VKSRTLASGRSVWINEMMSMMFCLYSSMGTCWDRLGMADGRTESFAPVVSQTKRLDVPAHRVTSLGSSL